eukprot:TRINITY_DN2029_c0_g1_i2.p1 TRINITY_DN2029_c0_g1~~TRINITY_DN2029_c0_g1_i2.p1  ORF type:complete len:320 (+),score=57.26 TRINITY_DN2029_c0_g1_i2:164-1123(+)
MASSVLKNSYRILDDLNSGNFGVVYSCEHLQTGEVFACKVIRKENVGDVSSLCREVQIMQQVAGQPNVIEIQDVLEDDKHIYIVMELCDGGDLFDRLQASGQLPEAVAKSAFRQIVNAIRFCHQRGIVHRDIKPENVLLKASKHTSLPEFRGKEWELKLADFGCSTFCPARNTLHGFYGSHHYMSPQIITGEGHTEKADIWSLGVVLFALLSGTLPFLGCKAGGTEEDVDTLFEAIMDGDYDIESYRWQSVSKNAKHLVRMMLAEDEARRPSAEQILMHPWFHDATFEVDGSLSNRTDISRESSLSSFRSASSNSSDEY